MTFEFNHMNEKDKARHKKYDELVNFSNPKPHINNSYAFRKPQQKGLKYP